MAVSVTGDHEAEAVVFGLIRSGYKLVASLEQEVTGRLATVRLVPPVSDDAGVIVDLLFVSCGIEPEVVAAATTETIARDVTAPVATVGHLIAMKTLSESDTRNQDRQDLIELIRAASPAVLGIARASGVDCRTGLLPSQGSRRGASEIRHARVRRQRAVAVVPLTLTPRSRH